MTETAAAPITVMTAGSSLSLISNTAAASAPPFTDSGNSTAASFVEVRIYKAADASAAFANWKDSYASYGDG